MKRFCAEMFNKSIIFGWKSSVVAESKRRHHRSKIKMSKPIENIDLNLLVGFGALDLGSFAVY